MPELNVSKPLNKVKIHFENALSQTLGVGESDRRTREKPPLSETDGRVARGKGKNIALNFRVTAELKQRFLAAANRHDITMTEVLERAMDAYEASEKG